MKLFYQCSDGTKINLMDSKITALQPETLLSQKWSYKTISGANGLGRVKNFFKDATERPLALDILADDETDFNNIMSNLHKHFELDVRNLNPGRIYWNDYYKECFIFASSPSDFDENFESVTQNLTVLSVYDYWVKETTYNYDEENTEDIQYGLDYPFDYGMFDYTMSDVIEVLKNDCISSANFKLFFFGPCSNPSVIINEHEYELVDVELEEGEYACINSLTKKITKTSIDGDIENIFHTRNKESYIFEPIPEGTVSVIRAKNLQLAITVCDERGEPVWI